MAIPQKALSNSVGFSGVNKSADVRLVQAMLNAVPMGKGGPMPALSVDGQCGPATSGAIRKFQSANGCTSDGRIDAGMTTEKKLLTLLDQLGKLTAILGGVGSGPAQPQAPTGPVPTGAATAVRQRAMAVVAGLLPPHGTYTQGQRPEGAKGTGCGEFPGRMLGKVPVKPRTDPTAFKITVNGLTLRLTDPTTWWELMAKEIDRKHNPNPKTWVQWTPGSRPLPGDIFLLSTPANLAEFQHVGVIVDATGPTWTTSCGGQGNGFQSGYVKREYNATDGSIRGESGKMARVKGWVDLDALYGVARDSFQF
jgi:peptidoglycan hydrolase-like protein with peptidoglycan-binding domain